MGNSMPPAASPGATRWTGTASRLRRSNSTTPPRSPSRWTAKAIWTSIPSSRWTGETRSRAARTPSGRRSTELAALHHLATEGNLGGEARSPSCRAVDVKDPSKRLDPVGETPQARSAGRVGTAETVVVDLDPHPSVTARYGNGDVG